MVERKREGDLLMSKPIVIRTKQFYFYNDYILDGNLALSMAQQPLVGQGLLIIEESRSHSDTR
jgi:hypothetical protein